MTDSGTRGDDATPDAEADAVTPDGDADPSEEMRAGSTAEPARTPEPAPPASRRTVSMPVAVPVTVALVLGLLIGGIAGWSLPRPDQSTQAAAVTDSAPATPDDATTATTVLSPATPTAIPGGPDGTAELGGLVIGTQGPIVELFEDYVCPFCAQLEQASGASLRASAQQGEFRFVLHPIAFLTEDSPRAANATACVYQHEDQDTWIAFHEALYARQDPSEAVGQYTTEVLLDLAAETGATSADVPGCIEDGTYEAWVAALTEQAFSRGVRGTPTLAVDGTVTDVAPLVQQ